MTERLLLAGMLAFLAIGWCACVAPNLRAPAEAHYIQARAVELDCAEHGAVIPESSDESKCSIEALEHLADQACEILDVVERRDLHCTELEDTDGEEEGQEDTEG